MATARPSADLSCIYASCPIRFRASTMSDTHDTARAWVEIDLGALVANARVLQSRVRRAIVADGQS